jgi:hypothetical protein
MRLGAEPQFCAEEGIDWMELPNEHPLSAAKRSEMLHRALYNAVTGVGAQLQHAEAPKALEAYKRLERSIQMTIRHALTQRIRGEIDGKRVG